MLSNDRRLWSPSARARLTRDHAFRIHEGRTLSGTLRWGTPDNWFVANQRELVGSYQIAWRDYADVEGPAGEFRWLAVSVGQPAGGATAG